VWPRHGVASGAASDCSGADLDSISGVFDFLDRLGARHGRAVFLRPVGPDVIGIGVWLATTPLRAAAAAKSTFYGITDRRVLIIEGTSTRRVRSWRGGEMSTLARAEHADGTGDVIFAREERRGNKGHRYWEEIGFFGISDARYVEGLVQQLRG
jgi:hypothetical protein